MSDHTVRRRDRKRPKQTEIDIRSCSQVTIVKEKDEVTIFAYGLPVIAWKGIDLVESFYQGDDPARARPRRGTIVVHPDLADTDPAEAFDLADVIENEFGGVIARDAGKIAHFVYARISRSSSPRGT